MNKRLIAPVASALAIFGFFMPWVSCGTITWNGMELASGNLGVMGDPGGGTGSAEPLLWAVPLAALVIIALYFSFRKNARLGSALIPTIVVAALAIFVMALKYVDVGNKNGELNAGSGQETPAATSEDSLGADIAEGMGKMMGSMVELKIEWGFWFTGLMFLAAIYGATQYRDLPKPPEDISAPAPPYSGEPPTAPSDETSNIPQDRGMT